MKKMTKCKKILSAMLIVMVFAVLLTGCKSEEDKDREKAKELNNQILGVKQKK